ncbi:MAG TPA: hypothetical protein VGN88_05050 [Phycisphaerae bacterium]|jgi:hypothetical protein
MVDHKKLWAAFLSLFLGACSIAPAPVAAEDRGAVRQGVTHFLDALDSGSEAQLSHATVVEQDPLAQQLAQAVLHDAASGRRLQAALIRRFDPPSDDLPPAVVGSDAWIEQFASTAAIAPMLQAGDRVRIGNEKWSGVIFLRLCNGQWKVELVPTLVAESGGRRISDSAVVYRFGVTAAVNEWLLKRLEQGEFHSYRDYQNARHDFWEKYIALIVQNQDPREKLLESLPPMPRESTEIASGE